MAYWICGYADVEDIGAHSDISIKVECKLNNMRIFV